MTLKRYILSTYHRKTEQMFHFGLIWRCICIIEICVEFLSWKNTIEKGSAQRNVTYHVTTVLVNT